MKRSQKPEVSIKRLVVKRPTATRVTSITIGRLYNLGNYEHVRFELTVEVPEGRSAAAALANTVTVLKGFGPIKSEFGYQRYLNLAKTPEPRLSDPPTNAEKQDHAEWVRAQRLATQYAAALKRREAALDLLDRMGGTSIYRDSKLDWDQDEF